jgi:soluble lytic murein transglycosylase
LAIVFSTGCSLGALPFGLTATPSLTRVPSQTPTPTPSPTPTATPTPIPEMRVANADKAFFNGDFDHARTDYQIALETAGDPEVRAAALWGLGRVDYAAGNSAQALEDLRQMVGTYPSSKNSPRAYFLLGEIYASLDRHTESSDAYSTYLGLRPGLIDYYVQVRLGDEYNAAGDFGRAIDAYKAALAAPHLGNDTALQIDVARAYADAGDTGTALGMYDSIFNASSNDYVRAQMDFLSGQIYAAQGKTDLADEKFLHAVNNYPLAYDSYSALVALVNANVPVDDLNRGLVDYYAGQYGYALDAFNRFITANPENDGTVHYYRALTLDNLGNYQEAVDEYSVFITNYPANDHWQSAWNDKAVIQWASLGHFDDAAQTLIDYTSNAPSSDAVPAALLEAGRIYERDGELDKAAATWVQIADKYPGSAVVPQALFWAGVADYRLGKYDQGLLAFQREVALSGATDDQSAAFFWIGKTQQKKGDAAAAQTAWQRAAAFDPTSYYSIRASDILFNRPLFSPAPAYNLAVDLAAERRDAEAWIRVKFNLPPGTDLSTPGALLSDPRLVRGTELWSLGRYDEAKDEFEDLRKSVSNDPANSYRLANYLLDLGLYYSAVFADRQVLTLAGMDTTAQTMAAPVYFNHVRFGLYYQDLIASAAERFGFQPLLLFAVMRQESLYEGFIQSGAGARGLMQIVPATGQEIARNMAWPNYTDNDLYRPLVSVDFGSYYLRSDQMYLGGDLYAALAAYNAGLGFAQSWQGLAAGDPDLFLEIVRLSETRDYIRGVYEIYTMYRSLYGTVP